MTRYSTHDFLREQFPRMRNCRRRLKASSISLVLLVLTLSNGQNSVADNSWTNAASGFWHDASNWNGGRPSTGDTHNYITNANSKVVLIDSTTGSGFSSAMTINKLSLWAPGGATNSLTLFNPGKPFVMLTTCTVSNGGVVTVTGATFEVDGQSGGQFMIIGGSVQLDSGAIVANTVTTRVGRVNTGSLNIQSGTFATTDLLVGDLAGSQGTLSIAGGDVTVGLELFLGKNPGAVGNLVMTGGQLAVTNDPNYKIRIGDLGVGQMTITGGSAVVGDMSVGRHGTAVGTLTVQGTGSLTMLTDLSIGRFTETGLAATGTLWVTGGQLDVSHGALFVGREAVGRMSVSNGTVTAVQVLVATNVISQGTLTLAGGTVNVTSNLVVGAPGSFKFTGGTLSTAGTAIAEPGQFKVGNGNNFAFYRLLGGNHVFAGGMRVSSNAVLSGCGTITGAVVNNGTIIMDCGTTLTFAGAVTNNATIQALNGTVVEAFGPFVNNGLLNIVRGGTNFHSTFINNGLMLTAAGDADGDGFTNLEEDVAGTDLLDPNSMPAAFNLAVIGSDSVVQIPSVTGRTYQLQWRASPTSGGWSNVVGAVSAGTGGMLSLTDPGGAAPANRVYRVRITQP